LIGKQAKELGVHHFYACGNLTSFSVKAFGEAGQHFSDQEALVNALRSQLHAGMTVLVKGSRSAEWKRLLRR